MGGLEVGVFPILGNGDIRRWLPLTDACDMSRVLITQMGLVTTVLLAPATMEDQKLMTCELRPAEKN